MSKTIHQINDLVLAIAPSSRGFGFAVLESGRTLVDWGVKSGTGDKNAWILKRIEKMIAQYNPGVLVLHDAAAKGSRRGPRIRMLTKKIVTMVGGRKLKVTLLSREEVMQAFFIDGKGTKYTIAKILAGRFSEELGHRLPRKRRAWEGEDSRMSIFESVALTVANRVQNKEPSPEGH